MKKIFILCLVLISINAIAQQVPPIPNGGVAPTCLANVIDNYYFGGSNQAAATKYWWQNSGCNIEQQHIDHFINVREYGVLGNGTTNDYNNVKNIIDNDNLVPNDGTTTMLYFPGGTYIFTTGGINLNNKKNIVIKGDGGGVNMPCITIFKFMFQCDDPPNFYYHAASFKLHSSENCGIEDIYIYRNDNGCGMTAVNYELCSNGIEMMNAKNCWVKGVTSVNAWKNHVTLNNCEKITVSGCYFKEAQVRCNGGEGYGILMEGGNLADMSTNPYSTHFCLIENNIFEHLRHAIVLQLRPQHNVIGYNYAFNSEGYDAWCITLWDRPDLSFHGRFADPPQNNPYGPSYNLIEGNCFEGTKFDNEHDGNGPFNTLFRNYTMDFGITTDSYRQNIVRNWTTDESANSTIQIYGLWLYSGMNYNNWPNSEYSYYKCSQPDFLTTWPYNPDNFSNSAVQRYNQSNGIKVVYEGWDKYTFAPLVINTNTTWNTDRTLYKNIIIEPNATLTINQCTITMPKEGKITVKPGAKLVIDGSTITAATSFFCVANTISASMWQGIEVWGTSNQPQESSFYDPNQGIVQIRGGTLEHAEIAINVYTPSTVTGGGIVDAVGARFLNNRRSVNFIKYTNTLPGGSSFRNLSSFYKCTFDVDNNYRCGFAFEQHVRLYEVNGVFFTACTFLNNQSNKQYNTGADNEAIYSANAGFTVCGSCSSVYTYGQICPPRDLIKSVFRGFNKAIEAGAWGTNTSVKIEDAIFQDNVYGVQFGALNNSWLNKSVFSVGSSSIANVPSDKQQGIVILSSTGYRIEENILNATQGNTVLNPIGIRVRNSGNVNNQIYKNTILGLFKAELAEGVNRHSFDNYQGLQFLCNIHFENTNDISVSPTGATILSDAGIRRYQGSPASQVSAGNTFSHSGSNSESDIQNGTSSSIMYCYTDGHTKPWYYTVPSVVLYELNNANTCPSTGNFSGLSAVTKAQLSSEYTTKETAYINLLYNYNSLIDGGNKNALLHEIEMSWPQDAWDLRTELLSKSPYLSEEILVKAAMKGILPQAMILEICLANPDGTRNEDFIRFLGEKIPNPLPQYMLDLIVGNWDAKTALTLLEGSLAEVSSKMAVISDLLISNSMFDSISDKAEIRSWLQRRGNISDYYSLAESYLESNDYITASFYANQIPNLFQLTKSQQAEYQNFTDYIAFRSSIAESGRDVMQLESPEIETLQQIAKNNTGRTSVMAQNILCFCYQLCTDYLLGESEGEHLKFTKPEKTAKELINSAYNKITATPNPANIFVAFTWELPLLNGNAELIITDINGKSIEQKTITTKRGQWIWDTRTIKKGIYLYEIKSDNERLGNGKIVINN